MATTKGGVVLAAVLCVALLAGQVAARSKDPKHTDKLVEFIKKKNYDKFVEELSREVDNGLGEPKGIDTNQPDSKGRLPIIEAVRTKDLKYVDALIQFGALTKVKDPATGATPVHVAFQQNMGEIARVLLAYGADINVEDKSNKKAREFAPSEDIRGLIIDYDKFGPSAFEDAPGTWIKEKKENGEMYWFNVKTNEARWNTPPSCGWVRVDIQGQPHKYINTVTGQEVTKTPAALAWALVRANSTEMWYNWRLNLTQVEQPDEPPSSVLDEARKNLNVRWYNEHTGDFSWEDPKYHGPWREVKEEGAEPYYFNVETGESRWEIPEELEWVVVDHETGRPYYFNQKSGDSSWEAPHPHLAWTKHDSDL